MTKSEGGKRTSNEGSESLEARATVTWVSPRVNRTPSLPSGGRGTSVVRKETQLDEMVYGRWGVRDHEGKPKSGKLRLPVERNRRALNPDVVQSAEAGAKHVQAGVIRENDQRFGGICLLVTLDGKLAFPQRLRQGQTADIGLLSHHICHDKRKERGVEAGARQGPAIRLTELQSKVSESKVTRGEAGRRRQEKPAGGRRGGAHKGDVISEGWILHPGWEHLNHLSRIRRVKWIRRKP